MYPSMSAYLGLTFNLLQVSGFVGSGTSPTTPNVRQNASCGACQLSFGCPDLLAATFLPLQLTIMGLIKACSLMQCTQNMWWML